MNLYQRSIEILLEHQHPSGAYVASPNFPTYHYSWFRDGSFCAYALNLVDAHDSAARFHAWAAAAVLRHAPAAERAISRARQGLAPGAGDILHTRYTLDGADPSSEDWPNFQLDGFGTWMWALGEHAARTGTALEPEQREAADLIAAYLEALWQLPCYDCWEEFPESVHPYTLAAIYAGLRAHSQLSGADHTSAQEAIRNYVLERGVRDGHFVKSIGDRRVDASLLGLSTPYRLVEPGDPIMRATAARIDRDLRRGGVHRYGSDTYYGGGEWVLLAAWLGWYWAEIGEFERARELQTWIEGQVNEKGELPEQVPASLNDPSYYAPWLERWGPIATPLLWSHAKYIILLQACGGRS